VLAEVIGVSRKCTDECGEALDESAFCGTGEAKREAPWKAADFMCVVRKEIPDEQEPFGYSGAFKKPNEAAKR
jgi:hypothetical protein